MTDSNSNFKSRVSNFVFRFGAFAIYATAGLLSIVAIEKTDDNEKERKSKLLAELQLNVTSKLNITEKEFDLLANAIYYAKSPSPLQWTYGSGFSFVIQVVTTIGYGNITPVTTGGKIFCIFYALFGIPITVLMLSTAGEEMMNCQKYIIRKIETVWLNKQDATHSEIKCLVAAFLMVFTLIWIGAALGKAQHTDWSLLDSFYCWFITFTTVGFGDFIPGHRQDSVVMVMMALYIILGLCAMSNVLNIMGEMASRGFFKIRFASNADKQTQIEAQDVDDDNNAEIRNSRL